MTATVHDVVVIGDGPAGSAVATNLVGCGVDVLLVGRDDAWTATYGTWTDDIDEIAWLLSDDVWQTRLPSIDVVAGAQDAAPMQVSRPYGVIHNDALRTRLRAGVAHRRADVDEVTFTDRFSTRLVEGDTIRSRLVIDATGWPGWAARRSGRAVPDVARQTAIGVVLPDPPAGRLGRPMLMDFSTTGAPDDVTSPTFAYALPVADGWLVEETVLAARPAVDPDRLLARLAARLGTNPDDLLASATRVERVDIAMGGPLPDTTSPIVAFGAAAGLIHPATGYSLSTSLRGAEPLARAIAAHLDAGERDPTALWNAVWPASARRARALHDYGLDVLLSLDAVEIGTFFGTFFELPTSTWASYLRIDTPPRRLAGAMARMFVGAPWPLRRSLVSANPRALARVLRP